MSAREVTERQARRIAAWMNRRHGQAEGFGIVLDTWGAECSGASWRRRHPHHIGAILATLETRRHPNGRTVLRLFRPERTPREVQP